MNSVKNWITNLGWQNIVASVGIYLLTVLLSYFFLIKPQFSEYDQILKDQESIGNTYVKLTQVNIEESIDSVDVQLGYLQQYRIEFESKISDEIDLKAALPFIDNIGKSGNLELTSLKIEDRKEKIDNKTEKRFVTMIVKSKYFFPLVNFFKDLDGYSKWISIESFDMKPSSDLNEMRLEISLMVQI